MIRMRPAWHSGRCRYSNQSRGHDPLRILFCGSGPFSIDSLRALESLRSKSSAIESIDVLCREDKRVGRGLTAVQEVPIKKVAQETLQLPLHQIDTFTGWQPPKPYNLIIAVSFGLLVPPRILDSAKYGGLNVHPSMLPDLRGPAPIQWALLNRLEHTGVTLQTLHPEHFDRGVIVDQTPQPGLPLPEVTKGGIYKSVSSTLAKAGAEMLCHSIESGSFVSPSSLPITTGFSRRVGSHPHAPKIRPEDRKINWLSWAASEIKLRDNVIGPLWDNRPTLVQHLLPLAHQSSHRIKFYSWRDMTSEQFSQFHLVRDDGPNEVVCAKTQTNEWRLCFRTCDEKIMSPDELTIEGHPRVEPNKLISNIVRRLPLAGSRVGS